MRLPLIDFGSRILKRQKPLLKGSDVRRLQQTLKHLGLFKTRVDGVYGYETAQAVRRFQSAFNIKQKNTADETEFELLKKLIKSGINKWYTVRRDHTYSGDSPIPIPIQLEISKTWPIPNIIWLNCRTDRLILTTTDRILALDLRSGRQLWKSKELSPKGPPAISEDLAILPTNTLHIIDLYSGKSRQTIDIGTFTSSVAADSKRIYAPSNGDLFTLDHSGSALWKYETSGAYATTPTLGYDLIYFASYDRHVYCLDRKGELRWKTKTPDIIKTPLALRDSMLFALSQDAWISALNPLTGRTIWRKKLFEADAYMPAFRRNFILFADSSSQVTAISAQKGEIKWKLDLPAIPTTPPITCGDTFFVGTEEGLIAYNVETLENKQYLVGKKIKALMPGALDLYVATSKKLIKFFSS